MTTTTLISTLPALSNLLDALTHPLPTSPLYLDLEGHNLSRHGTISLLTLMPHPLSLQRNVYLLDIHTLGSLAFSTPSTKTHITLKDILENPFVTKVFFDVRNDSDALHAHFNIKLHGIEDVQLMENAARFTRSRRHLCGLARCISSDAGLGGLARARWEMAKARGERLFKPELGGGYHVFDVRPLSEELSEYCAGDVVYLPVLRGVYWGRLAGVWRERVRVETERRVVESQAVGYLPSGPHKVFGPWA